jgi:hypothetical protein
MSNVFDSFDKRLKSEIRLNLDRTGVKAFGKSGDELFDERTDESYKLLGVGYWLWIDRGRGVTKKAGDGISHWKGIFEWLKLKKYGINYKTEKERASIAWAIKKTHDEKGSFRFRRPEKSTTILRDSIRAALPKLRKELIKREIKNIRINVVDNLF